MRQRPILLLLVVMGVSLLPGIRKVSACSFGGPGPTFEDIVSGAATIVRARVIESDIARQNYILQVESYLTGEAGPEFLLLAYNSPTTIQGMVDTNLGGGDCNFFSQPLPEHKVGYFYLGAPAADGAYHESIIFSFITWVDFFPVDINDADGNVTGTYNQAQFEQYIADLRDSKPSDPLPNSRYPSTAPLLITTENGDEYVLPVADTKLAPVDPEFLKTYNPTWIGTEYAENTCKNWDCVTWSSDGRTLIIELEDNFAYIQEYNDFRFEADSFLISPLGLAVWQDDDLIIYALHDSLRYASDRADIPREVARVTIERTSVANADHSVWSPDGRLLAFSDARGLWLWDVFAPDAPPTLLRPSDSDIPTALQFSGHGRYLGIKQGENRLTLDLLTDNTLPFGYISPDERLMVRCEPQPTLEPDVCPLQLEQLAPQAMMSGWGIEVKREIHVEWVNDRHVLIQGCESTDKTCGVIDSNAYGYNFNGEWFNDYNIAMSFPTLKPALDFVVQGRNVAILIDSSTIEVNGTTLSFDLESPITKLRWLPSLFYGENPYQPQLANWSG